MSAFFPLPAFLEVPPAVLLFLIEESSFTLPNFFTLAKREELLFVVYLPPFAGAGTASACFDCYFCKASLFTLA